MKCPNCGKEMKYYSHASPFGMWNDDDDYYLVEEWKCGKCRIMYREDHWSKEWDIPSKYQASEKQIKACKFISNWLDYDIPPPCKHAMWEFIKAYLDDAIKTKNNREQNDYWDDDYDYPIPE